MLEIHVVILTCYSLVPWIDSNVFYISISKSSQSIIFTAAREGGSSSLPAACRFRVKGSLFCTRLSIGWAGWEGGGACVWVLAPVCSASSERWRDFHHHTLWLSHTHTHSATETGRIETVSISHFICDLWCVIAWLPLFTVSSRCAIPSCVTEWMMKFMSYL